MSVSLQLFRKWSHKQECGGKNICKGRKGSSKWQLWRRSATNPTKCYIWLTYSLIGRAAHSRGRRRTSRVHLCRINLFPLPSHLAYQSAREEPYIWVRKTS